MSESIGREFMRKTCYPQTENRAGTAAILSRLWKCRIRPKRS